MSAPRTEPERLVPNPLLSRGKPVHASVDPPWVALQVGVGPRRVLLSWACPPASAPASSVAPSNYRIETSANSSQGNDGTWRLELSVSDNTASARAHSLEFDGQSWVRLSLGGDPDADSRCPGTVDVYDASDGCDDTWLLLGDAGPDGELPLSARHFASTVHERYPGYFPAIIDGRAVGDTPRQALGRLNELLGLHREVRHFVLGYAPPAATAHESSELSAWHDSVRELIARLREAGKVPVLAPSGQSAWADAMDDLYVPV